MVAFPRQRLILPIAPVAAGLTWIALALLFAAVSPATLDGWANASGLPSLLGIARPPLGFTARLVLILLGGGGAALAVWLSLSLKIGQRAVLVRRQSERTPHVPVLRRADAHPDAPARAPISAGRELGTPFLEVSAPVAERTVPQDLDQPLAAFDPTAIPATPMAPVPSVAPLAKLPPRAEPVERLETFELTPMVRTERRTPATRTIVAPDTAESISALLERLERGVASREGLAA